VPKSECQLTPVILTAPWARRNVNRELPFGDDTDIMIEVCSYMCTCMLIFYQSPRRLSTEVSEMVTAVCHKEEGRAGLIRLALKKRS
jgi:hypothetical protein